MDEGVATFSGLFLDRSGWNLKLRFSLYNYDRATGDWEEAWVHYDTDFFHVGEGVPAALQLEQVKTPETCTARTERVSCRHRSMRREAPGAKGGLLGH